MKYLIIEDEPIAAERLLEKIASLRPTWQCLKILGSLEELENELPNTPAELAFADIHLGDGSSFIALEKWQVRFPLIFTTAYDQYAIRAFKLNSIDYLVKPIHTEDLKKAVEKFERNNEGASNNMEWRKVLAALKPQYKERFLVAHGERLKTISTKDVAFFYASAKHCFLTTIEGKEYLVDGSLKDLKDDLDPRKFFQINRRYVVNLESIEELVSYSKSRVKVLTKPRLPEEGIVSSERTARFKAWLQGEINE